MGYIEGMKPHQETMMQSTENDFIAFEYREVTVERNLESLYIDYFPNFGWIVDRVDVPATLQHQKSTVRIKFKRDRKLLNRAELTRLQRQFESCISEISAMEKSKQSKALIATMTVALIGTGLMAAATFLYLAGYIIFSIIVAIPGFIGWILPMFVNKFVYEKQREVVSPLIELKYDELYEVCKRANNLINKKEEN